MLGKARRDGSVSSFNSTLWLCIVAVAILVPILGHRLRSHGRTGLAIAVLSILAVPGLIFGVFALLLLVMSPHWNRLKAPEAVPCKAYLYRQLGRRVAKRSPQLDSVPGAPIVC